MKTRINAAPAAKGLRGDVCPSCLVSVVTTVTDAYIGVAPHPLAERE